MRRLTLLCFFVLCVVRMSEAQITITRADLEAHLRQRIASVEYEGLSTDGLEAIVSARGNGQTWDLRGIAFEKTMETLRVPATLPVPGSDDPDLMRANVIHEVRMSSDAASDSVAYSYEWVGDEAYMSLGMAARYDLDEDGVEDEFKLKFMPGNVLMALPLTFGRTWSAEYLMETEPSIPLTTTISETSEVVGAGELLLPLPGGGTRSAEVLMIHTRTVSTITYEGFPLGSDTSYSVVFVTHTGVGASISLDGDGVPEGVSFSISGQVGTGDEPEVELPNAVALHPGHPNPFNPATAIPFTLAEAGAVRLEVFDLLGRRVALLLDDVRPAGDHTVRWSAAGMPSGTYLCRLTAGSQVRTQMLTLQK